ncbi:MAG: hypothetical protein MI919_35825 [Holophagales bacterium]|nr:hypothetical protein [Holophagales bacterium]
MRKTQLFWMSTIALLLLTAVPSLAEVPLSGSSGPGTVCLAETGLHSASAASTSYFSLQPSVLEELLSTEPGTEGFGECNFGAFCRDDRTVCGFLGFCNQFGFCGCL